MRTRCPNKRRSDKPFIIPVFIPHQGCPHQCVFCNQTSITGRETTVMDAGYVRAAVESFLKHASHVRSSSQIAFYGGNFLGLPDAVIVELLSAAGAYVENRIADSLRFSTRPDTVTSHALALIRDFPVKTVEIGAQSMDDQVLRRSGRGHASEDAVTAVRLLKEAGCQVGVQMMVGLPGDDERKALDSAARIAALKPDFVRIYPTVVLEGSPLAARYRAGGYAPLEVDACVDLVKRIYLRFERNNIPVIRMGLQLSETGPDNSPVIAGPYHPAFGHMVLSAVFLERAAALGRDWPPGSKILLRVHPRNLSRMQGLQKRNLLELERMFSLRQISVQPDASLDMDEVRAERKNELDV